MGCGSVRGLVVSFLECFPTKISTGHGMVKAMGEPGVDIIVGPGCGRSSLLSWGVVADPLAPCPVLDWAWQGCTVCRDCLCGLVKCGMSLVACKKKETRATSDELRIFRALNSANVDGKVLCCMILAIEFQGFLNHLKG